ncbi:MAG: Dabb family protein [Pseudomonadota bacterium]
MLAHCVFCNFADAHSAEARLAVLRELGTLIEEIDGMISYHYGPNLDFEAKTPEHQEGFIVMFEDRAAHLRYEAHPRHVALGGQLVKMCVGGADGILVYDLDLGGTAAA